MEEGMKLADVAGELGTLTTVMGKTVVPKGTRLYVCICGVDDDMAGEGWTLVQVVGVCALWQKFQGGKVC